MLLFVLPFLESYFVSVRICFQLFLLALFMSVPFVLPSFQHQICFCRFSLVLILLVLILIRGKSKLVAHMHNCSLVIAVVSRTMIGVESVF